MTNKKMKIILASTSENRRRLLERMNFQFEVIAPDYEEIIDPVATPEGQVKIFALGKAESVWKDLQSETGDFMVLGFDSMISFEGGSLGKARDKAEALKMLTSFIGKTQDIVSGMAVIGRYQGRSFSEVIHESTNVKFRTDITTAEIEKYLEFGDWAGKCGAYSILGTGTWFLEYIDGDFQNIVGVPVLRLGEIMRSVTGKAPVELLTVA